MDQTHDFRRLHRARRVQGSSRPNYWASTLVSCPPARLDAGVDVIVAMKSYGRAPTFLLATGYQRVRSVVAALAGDRPGAARRDQGPPAATLCTINRDLLAGAQRRRQLLPSVPTASSGTTAALGRTAADWSSATCCP